MPILTSIESLDKANIIETQNRPIIIHASDLNFYYCKYHYFAGTAHRLFKEYLIGSFLDCWQLKHSPISLIEVLPEHIPSDLTIPRNRFDVPCFRLQKLENAFDLNQLTENLLEKSRNNIELKADLIKLAFFDIWISNEDRHLNNYNILVKLDSRKYTIYPIDHEACFNSQNLENGLYQITFEDSLIYSTLFSKLFKINEFSNKARTENLKESFYLCTLNCRRHLKSFLENIPAGWSVDIAKKEEELHQYLLNKNWFEECWHTFLDFLQYFTDQ
ncbi:MAG: hypothetical protein KGM98_05070 [Bacteroidota bacterium]|nr:hypothetical protein [Bacteroidota bacterium]